MEKSFVEKNQAFCWFVARGRKPDLAGCAGSSSLFVFSFSIV